MRKNQKYSQEEMYAAIEHCKKQNLSHVNYCKQSGIHYASFKYWISKYEKANQRLKNTSPPSFVPVQISTAPLRSQAPSKSERISITYPNGTQVSCPSDISPTLLQTLLND